MRMKNWQDTNRIFRELEKSLSRGGSAAICTIVNIKGSAYRRPGAKLLVSEEARMIGNVSGGCLESNLREVGQGVLKTGQSRLVHYDTSGTEDMLWGFGLGCNGEIDILVNPLTTQQVGLVDSVRQRLAGDEPFGLVTALDDASCFIVDAKGISSKAPEWKKRENGMVQRFQELLTDDRSTLQEFDGVRVFIDVLTPPPHLVVFGAGDDSMPLERYASEAGFRVTLVDHRPAFLSEERFPGAFRLVQARPDDGLGRIPATEKTYAVVKTHALVHDREWMRRLLNETPVPYIGLMGPRTRREQILQEIMPDGSLRIFGPVGLDVGAEGPEQVALSIVSEILAIHAGRDPGHLRDRQRPIHAP